MAHFHQAHAFKLLQMTVDNASIWNERRGIRISEDTKRKHYEGVHANAKYVQMPVLRRKRVLGHIIYLGHKHAPSNINDN